MPSHPFRKKSQGMTFIEVLIALVILVTGILGAVAMQATAKKGSFDAMQRSLASALAQDILERMRSNISTTAVLSSYEGNYGVPPAPPVPLPAVRCNTAAALCTPAQRVANDLYEWSQSLRGGDVTAAGQNTGGLVGAIGCISETKNAVTITISWQGRTLTKDGAKDNSACGAANRKRRQIYIEAFIY